MATTCAIFLAIIPFAAATQPMDTFSELPWNIDLKTGRIQIQLRETAMRHIFPFTAIAGLFTRINSKK